MTGGVHAAVFVQEAIAALNVRPDGIYVDCTFGRGGHSRLILERLDKGGRLIAFDRDPEAVQAGQLLRDPRFTILHGAFSKVGVMLRAINVEGVDGLLFDLGVSSPQLDDGRRGFSFRHDAQLDMRMDTTQGISAAQWLATASAAEIGGVIKKHGEERFAKQIAAAVVAARARGPVDTTRQLAEIVAQAVPTREPRQNPATRTFQALRIHINQELEELSVVLPQCVDLLNPGGRLVVISFHSLEDRIVKRFLRHQAQPDALPARLPVRARELPQPRLRLVGRAQRPGAAEIAANPRARSAVMRIAERVQAGLQ